MWTVDRVDSGLQASIYSSTMTLSLLRITDHLPFPGPSTDHLPFTSNHPSIQSPAIHPTIHPSI
ncbi:MAG: hypothetical protein GY859_26790 [Desulfobacterales bacterium]|nr:hypothetical protein [Desulfobacterales bacterium]